ncbi:MAG: peptidoglycan bridge formation glycyltransferase FemA/FemB family protein, partial [Butyricicoccus porcorum]
YGASANGTKEFDVRKLMPNYLLQWMMIQWALEKGCRIYDFRGVSGDLTPDNPLYGLYRFKKDFNGDLVQFVGEYDLVFNKPVHFAVVHGQSTYRNLRRKRFLKKNAALDTSKPKNLTGDHRGEKKEEPKAEKKTDAKPESK